jgi:hypothetical protein
VGLAAFGLPGRLDFTRLWQPWLRESARRWASDNLPRRRGKIAAGPVRHYLTSLAMLSDSLYASCDDQGTDPAALGRPDIKSFASGFTRLTIIACSVPWSWARPRLSCWRPLLESAEPGRWPPELRLYQTLTVEALARGSIGCVNR